MEADTIQQSDPAGAETGLYVAPVIPGSAILCVWPHLKLQLLESQTTNDNISTPLTVDGHDAF